MWSGEWYRDVSGGCGRGVVKGVVMWSELEKGVGCGQRWKGGWRCGQE